MNDAALANIVQDASSLVAITQGEVDVQIATAKKFPRSLEGAIQKVERFATLDRDTAESCFYSVPMDGSTVTGPSVRLAEIVLGAWGNARAATRCIEVTLSHVKCQGVFFDLENNISVSQEVSRSILTKTGKRYSESQIMKTIAAGCAIALRNAVFKAVPMGIFKGTIDKVKKVAAGSEKDFSVRVEAAIAWFEGKGIEPKRILEHFGIKSKTEFTVDFLVELTGIRSAIKDEELTLADAFPAKTTQKTNGDSSPKTLDDVCAKPTAASQQSTQGAEPAAVETDAQTKDAPIESPQIEPAAPQLKKKSSRLF